MTPKDFQPVIIGFFFGFHHLQRLQPHFLSFLGGRRFHKRCFKCVNCSKKLDSNNVRVHGSKLYCKVCLDKIAPAESPKIYSDTSKIAPTDEKGCPRCGGAVYEAEKITVKEDVYHKKCLTCNKCTRALDSLSLSVAPDANVYCKV